METVLGISEVKACERDRVKMRAANRGEYLYFTYLRNFDPDVKLGLNSFRTRFIRNITQVLAILGRFDVCGKSKSFGQDQAQENSHKFLGLEFFNYSDWWRRQKYRWVSDVGLILYAVINVYFVINLYHQYSYDFNKLRLERLRALMQQSLISGAEFARLSSIFFERAYESRQFLLRIGPPYKLLSIVTECLYLYGLIFGIVLYYMNSMYFRLVTPYDFHFIRELLDYEDERHYSDQLVRWQVSCFLESDRNFFAIDQYRPKAWRNPSDSEELIGQSRQRHRRWTGPGQRQRGLWQKLAGNEYRMQDVLMQMLASGALRPFNESARWIEKRIMIYYVTLGGLTLFVVLFSSSLLLGVAFYSRNMSQRVGLGEVSLVTSVFGLAFLIGAAAIFTACTVLIATLDQLFMVNKMRKLILACLSENQTQFDILVGLVSTGRRTRLHQYSGEDSKGRKEWHFYATNDAHYQDWRERSRCVDLMNSNLLFVILHYKIFIEQHKPSVRMARALPVYAIGLIMLIPITIKLHIPYLNLFNYQNVKRAVLLIIPTVWVPANSILLPLCLLDSRVVGLFQDWSSLMGHILETTTHPAARDIYDPHMIALLLKEMAHAFRFEYRPKWSILTLSPNYITLLRVHFWWGIILLSILFDDQSSDRLGTQQHSSMFADPFGVFSESNFLGAR